MLTYLIRRLLYMVPILLGVMVITFILFYVVNSPRQMALRILGPKASPQSIENWLHNRGYDKPVYFNTRPGQNLFDSQLFNTIKQLATFDLGVSDSTGVPVLETFEHGAIPSLLITLPAFVIGLCLAISVSLLLVFVRESLIDRWGVILSVATMSIPITVYVIFCQWLAANVFAYFPAFGFNLQGLSTVRFLALPVSVMVIAGIGSDVRLYRAVFLEEARADYIRTAHAKGASNTRVLFVHVLKNGLISIVTMVVAALPSLILGTLVLESFFGIPGLGDLMATAIHSSDFALIKADVYLGSILYLIGLLLTDVCYAAVDPRIRLQ